VTKRLGAPDFLLPERRARIDRVIAERTRTLILVMEALADVQNVNAVLRTAEAFGVQEVHVIEGPMKAFDRNKKISKNADKWLDVVRWKSSAECLRSLKERGFAVYATHLGEGTRDLSSLSFAGPVALVFGNEHRGVSDEALALADLHYAIPMRGFSQSFNVSVAVAVSLFRAVDRRLEERAPRRPRRGRERGPAGRFYARSVKQRTRIARAERAGAPGQRPRGRHGGGRAGGGA
jgi:tRNA (guanosine-2'-O-)-methyltransferase